MIATKKNIPVHKGKHDVSIMYTLFTYIFYYFFHHNRTVSVNFDQTKHSITQHNINWDGFILKKSPVQIITEIKHHLQ